MSAMLPPEIGDVLEKLFGAAASKADNSWIDDYVTFEEAESHGIMVSRAHIKDEDMAGLLGKAIGHYTTLQTGLLSGYDVLEDICACLTDELNHYLAPYKGKSLCICGIGNADLLTDSLGPETAKRIYPRVPMQSAFEEITVFYPGVQGNTNIETNKAISSIAAMTGADCVLAIDSTDCSDYANLGSTIQLTDAGLRIHKNNEYLAQSTIGKPVISIGVPTVIHVNRLASDMRALGNGFLTVSDIAEVIKRAALVIASAVLQVAYPELDYQASRMIAEGTLL